MAEENLSVFRQSNRTVEPVSIWHQSDGNGFPSGWSCRTLLHLRIRRDDRSHAEVRWWIRYYFEGRSSICWVYGGLVRIPRHSSVIRVDRGRGYGSRDL